MDLINFHTYDDNGLCYSGEFVKRRFLLEKKGLKNFFEEMIIPFLYDQSYFRKHKKWVRGDLSHGTVGVLEEYYRLKINTYDDLFYAFLILSLHSRKNLQLKNLLKKIFWKKLKKVKGGYSYIGGIKLKAYPTIEPLLGLRKLRNKIKSLKKDDFLKLQKKLRKFDFCDFLFE